MNSAANRNSHLHPVLRLNRDLNTGSMYHSQTSDTRLLDNSIKRGDGENVPISISSSFGWK